MECFMAVVDIVCPEKSCYFQPLVFLERQLRDELRICQQVRGALRTPALDLTVFL